MTNSFDTVNNMLSQKNKQTFYNPINNESNKKVVDPETSRNPKYIVEFINSLKYTDETKEILIKWYYAVGIRKVNVKILKDSITKLYQTVKTEAEAREAYNNSYLSQWLTFYPPTSYNKSKLKNNAMYQESIQAKESDFLTDENGNKLEF